MLPIITISIDNQLKAGMTIILSEGSTPVEHVGSNLSLYNLLYYHFYNLIKYCMIKTFYI